MAIKFIPITGKIVSHGDGKGPVTKDGSNPESLWTYSYIVFKEDETGEEITVHKCQVHGTLNQHLSQGNHGTWLIAKMGDKRMLLGYRDAAGQQTINDWALNPKGQIAYPVWVFMIGLMCCVTLILIMIGIPVMIYAVFLFFKLQSLPKQLRKGLEEHGFELKAARTI